MPLKQVLCPFSNLGWPAPDQAGFLICKNVPFLRPPPSPARSAPQSLGRRLSKRAHDAWSPTSFFFQALIQKPSERERERVQKREYILLIQRYCRGAPHPSLIALPPGPRAVHQQVLRAHAGPADRAAPASAALAPHHRSSLLAGTPHHRCPGKNRENAAASKKGRQYW